MRLPRGIVERRLVSLLGGGDLVLFPGRDKSK
jgi:hypothetical protein